MAVRSWIVIPIVLVCILILALLMINNEAVEAARAYEASKEFAVKELSPPSPLTITFPIEYKDAEWSDLAVKHENDGSWLVRSKLILHYGDNVDEAIDYICRLRREGDGWKADYVKIF